ncbi:MAG: hypothetical protein ACOZNI_03205 [Myxococcota bacterium]
MLAWLFACSDYELNEEPKEVPFDSGGDTSSPFVDTGEPLPDIAVDPSEYDAGDVLEGSPVTVTVTLSNVGDAALSLALVESGWGMDVDLTGSAIPPNGGASVTLSTVAVAGEVADVLRVRSDDPDEPIVEVPLRYRGVSPCSWELWHPDTCEDGGWGGTGADGEGVLSGDFAPTVTTLTADVAGTVLAVADETGFAVDDEVFLHGADGSYAFARVVGLAPLTVQDAVAFSAGTVVQRVPHYTDVRVEGASGARVVFRACGTVSLSGDLSAAGLGWAGGQRTTTIPELGWQGASETGAGGQSNLANGTGGGGGSESCNVHADGGGGGHATAGAKGGDWDSYPCGGPGGDGGGTIGDASLATLHLGGGGGGGYLDNDAGGGSYGGRGGAGGGIVRVVATGGFTGAGAIRADGAAGEDGFYADGGASPGGGGGGAGGSVWLVGDVGVAVSAAGGAGGVGSEAGGSPTTGGQGGDGRVRIDGAVSGTVSPEPYLGCP